MPIRSRIVIHGGAGAKRAALITTESHKAKLREAASVGLTLAERGDALGAAIAAVTILEDDQLFNAGNGSVLCQDGSVEMSASLMCGKSLRVGSVALVRETMNPIQLARIILDEGPHVFLVSDAAEQLGRQHGLTQQPNEYFRSERQLRAWQERMEPPPGSMGTVGAVVLDEDGNLAAATSTGGTAGQIPGRISDSAVIGAGTYAMNGFGAVSCTGIGEAFIRTVAAFDVIARVRSGAPIGTAADEVVSGSLAAVGGMGGLIAVGQDGTFATPFNTDLMFRCWNDDQGAIVTRVFGDRDV